MAHWSLAHRTIAGQRLSFVGHEYLEGIYRDESPSIVFEKAAQMGASEYAITRALWFVCVHGGRVLYFFPTIGDVADFARDRFDPAIQENPYLKSLVRNTDNVGLKQVGQGSIYFRGMRGRSALKSVPGDFLIFDELDEMDPKQVELAERRIGHSAFGWILYVSTPSFPQYGVDAAFEKTDQRFWLLRCEHCGRSWCLEDEFLERYGADNVPRDEIAFVQGEPKAEVLVCLHCGGELNPALGSWVAKHPDRGRRGYHVSKFISTVLSQKERAEGYRTKPAALLGHWRETRFPSEFFNSDLGLPYLAAEGGITEQDLEAIAGDWPQTASGVGCVMGVDQGNGLHVVVKEPHGDYLLTVCIHHEPRADESFSALDRFMVGYDVRVAVIDAMPSTHSARAFAKRYPGRVWLRWFVNGQRGIYAWGRDEQYTPVVKVNRTEAFDAWRDVLKTSGKRRIPRADEDTAEYRRQLTNVLRKVSEDPDTGLKQAFWIKRGPDHFAHADLYAEIAAKRLQQGTVSAGVIG